MSIETLRDMLQWCAIINYGVLLLWFLAFILARDSMHRLHGQLFRMRRINSTWFTTREWRSIKSAFFCST